MENEVLQRATFNPKVKTYIFLVVIFYLIISVIGILILPVWLFGFGQWLSNKFFNTLKCELTTKNLKFSKGLILHIEKTIPLENIQDLSFIGGPILRSFGLTLIKVETAGGGGAHHSNMMSMIGINDAEAFKNRILEQREVRMKEKSGVQQNSSPALSTNMQGSEKLLLDIKNELSEIKYLLREKK
ncbi:MAG: PH domain-containing protein [Sphingobacteriaceae bacterium]|nr:PH domain-containing protein [Sphingobacteriaceae bacterium]